jgi:hypothetical protein
LHSGACFIILTLAELLMACTLSVCTGSDADYQGTTDASFEISVSSPSGTATLNYALYNGKPLTVGPWKFNVAAGVKVLTLVIESTVMGDRISIKEITNGCNQILDAYDYTPSLGPEGLEIKGL